jgi:hypothetical protein
MTVSDGAVKAVDPTSSAADVLSVPPPTSRNTQGSKRVREIDLITRNDLLCPLCSFIPFLTHIIHNIYVSQTKSH